MRLRKPYRKCRFCGSKIPIELFLYDGLTFLRDGTIRRMYRCSLCKATIYTEKVTEIEKIKGMLDDPLFTGEKTIYGCKHKKAEVY